MKRSPTDVACDNGARSSSFSPLHPSRNPEGMVVTFARGRRFNDVMRRQPFKKSLPTLEMRSAGSVSDSRYLLFARKLLGSSVRHATCSRFNRRKEHRGTKYRRQQLSMFPKKTMAQKFSGSLALVMTVKSASMWPSMSLIASAGVADVVRLVGHRHGVGEVQAAQRHHRVGVPFLVQGLEGALLRQ